MTLLSPNFADSFKRYWTDPLFVSAFKAVRKDFLSMTGRSGLTGVPYVVLCLLMAQAMQRLLDGRIQCTITTVVTSCRHQNCK